MSKTCLVLLYHVLVRTTCLLVCECLAIYTGLALTCVLFAECWCAGKDRIEQLLALGATRWEATQASIQRCVRVALTPILNQMNVVGIVSIPGMMTGQILSGSDPSQVLLNHPCCAAILLPDVRT